MSILRSSAYKMCPFAFVAGGVVVVQEAVNRQQSAIGGASWRHIRHVQARTPEFTYTADHEQKRIRIAAQARKIGQKICLSVSELY